MPKTEPSRRAGQLVPGAHRVIRALDAAEGPFAGTLVAQDDSVAVLVDAVALSGWRGWRYATAQHVAGPLDLVRRADGQDVLLPWCTERVTSFLGRRVAAGAPLAAGETATLVASLLRGIDELAAGEPDDEDAGATGEWWLTDAGRPVFVIGAGPENGQPAISAAAEIVALLRRDCADRALGRVLAAVEDGIRDAERRARLSPAVVQRWESELFAIAAPKPLRRELHSPERARDLARAVRDIDVGVDDRRSRRRSAGEPRDPRAATPRERMPERRSVRSAPALLSSVRPAARRVVDAVAAGLGARSGPPRAIGHRTERRLDEAGRSRRVHRLGAAGRSGRAQPQHPAAASPPPRRGRLALIAAASAAAVLTGGLLWPVGATGEPVGDGTAGDESAVSEPSAGAAGEGHDEKSESARGEPADAKPGDHRGEPGSRGDDDTPPDVLQDPVRAADALLGTIRRCAEDGDARCADAVADGSFGVVGALGGLGEATAALVDEYGDIAVVRITPESASTPDGAGERMLVLVRVDEKWLVRDAYGVADQPG